MADCNVPFPLGRVDTRFQANQLLEYFVGAERDGDHGDGTDVVDAHSAVQSPDDAMRAVGDEEGAKEALRVDGRLLTRHTQLHPPSGDVQWVDGRLTDRTGYTAAEELRRHVQHKLVRVVEVAVTADGWGVLDGPVLQSFEHVKIAATVGDHGEYGRCDAPVQTFDASFVTKDVQKCACNGRWCCLCRCRRG